MFVDTHCHIHDASYQIDPEAALADARSLGVDYLICVGTTQPDSQMAINFARSHDGVYSSIGVHPHDTHDGYSLIRDLASQRPERLVAIGEIGLDYFYTHSPREVQIAGLESQLQTALDFDLPVIFHVREAFEDFWSIFDNFHGIRGVLHSFTDTSANCEQGMKRGLYIGVNGISTFTKSADQQTMFRSIPLEKLVLETDAPFLTPVPKRGKVNQPAYVTYVAEHHAAIRDIPVQDVASATTANARAVFAL